MKIVVGDGQYVIYAKDLQEAREVGRKEMQRIDDIKEKMANLLSKDGVAYKNFIENTAVENLNIHFNDETSLIFDNPENYSTKGEVRQREVKTDGRVTYDLAYRYPDIAGHNADFRLAHEMGHLVLNPSNANRQVYNKDSNSLQVAGLIRRDENSGQLYGMQIQENAINLMAQLAIRGNEKADDIIQGKVDLSEYNSYKRCDDLVKLIAVSMRNDFDKEMSFEQLAEQKIDSMITRKDGTQVPANTFFYGIVNDSSIVENEFDKYCGKGAWKEINESFRLMYDPNISQEKFERIYQSTQGLVQAFAIVRYKDKYQEAVKMNGELNTPSLENKMKMIDEMTERVNNRDSIQQNGFYINKYGEIVRPNEETNNLIPNENIPIFTPPVSEVNQGQNKLSFKQKIAQFLQRNNLFMNLSFVDKFVHRQLDLLPEATQETRNANTRTNSTRESFINELTNFGQYRNLSPQNKMFNQEEISEMKKLEQEQQSKDNDDLDR